jgi:hypothetical protein
MQREQDYHVIAAAESNADSDGAVMAIALEIEKALAMPVVGPWQELTLRESRVLRDGTGQKVNGQRVLVYRASYFARENAPDA